MTTGNSSLNGEHIIALLNSKLYEWKKCPAWIPKLGEF